MTSEPFTFATMLDDAALLSLEHQLHLEELLGEHRWSVDLQHPRFEFTGDHPLRCTSFHLLGTAAPGPRSWLWSWANPQGYAPQLTELAASLRDFGTEFHIGELVEPEVPFSDLPGPPDHPAAAVSTLTEAAKIVSGHWTSYSGDAGGGTRAAFLIDHPQFALPPPRPERVVRVLQQGIAELALTDHRRAVYAYATRRPLAAEAAADWSSVRLTAAGLDLTITFSGVRISSINASIGPA